MDGRAGPWDEHQRWVQSAMFVQRRQLPPLHKQLKALSY
jgi:hypothetical protein